MHEYKNGMVFIFVQLFLSKIISDFKTGENIQYHDN